MPLTLVTFFVHADVNPGQRIYLAGDGWALGDFRKDQAVELVTTPMDFPIWRTPRPIVLRSNKAVHYRYLVFTGDSFESWEPIQSHSRSLIPQGNSMTVRDEFGVYNPEKAASENTAAATGVSEEIGSQVSASPPTMGVRIAQNFSPAMASETSEGAASSHGEMTPVLAGAMEKVATTTTATSPVTTTKKASRVIIVSFHLPVFLHKNKETGEWSATWNYDSVTAKSERQSIADSYKAIWVGAITERNCPGYSNERWEFDQETKEAITRCLKKLDCVPLFMDPKLYHIHYNLYCKNRLWYLFHNILRVDRTADEIHTIKGDYEGYALGTRFFADAVLAMIDPASDIVWIHDYHLLLLPNYIREGAIAAGKKNLAESSSPHTSIPIPIIVFFLHVPFPTSEIFRTLSVRNELLEGLLGASLIGFHTFDHARHFLTCCKRFLGASYQSRLGGNLMLAYAGRSVVVTISHLGIDHEKFESILSNQAFNEMAAKMKAEILTRLSPPSSTPASASSATAATTAATAASSPKEITPPRRSSGTSSPSTSFFPKKIRGNEPPSTPFISMPSSHFNKIVLVGLGALERLQGIPLQLLAFEKLLTDVPRLSRKLRFVQWAILSGSLPADEMKSQAEVRELVARINNAHGPVVELREFTREAPPTLEERIALWCLGDVFVHTPVSEGLNLLPIEYLFCHRKPSAGVVIISEFAACSRVLNGAFRVNCYDIAMVAKLIDQAIRMSPEERDARRARDMSFILAKSGLSWSTDIINEAATRIGLADQYITAIDDTADAEDQHVIDKDEFVELDTARVKDAYINSKRRLILFDFVGTLLERERENLTMKRDFLGVARRKISPSTLRTLLALCNDPRNIVFVVSQSSIENITLAFSELLEKNSRLGLVAFNGLCVRWGPLQKLRVADSLAPDAQKGLQLLFVPSSSVSGGGDAISSSTVLSTGANERKEKELQLAGWEMMMDSLMGNEWRQWMLAAKIPSILEDYTWHTGGTEWYMSNVSTVWEFRHADPELGGLQATRLTHDLNEALSSLNIDVRVARKKGSVQLLPKGADKGTAVDYILGNLFPLYPPGKYEQPDFCLCIGDEAEDELMFAEIMEYIGSGSEAQLYRPFNHQTATTEKGEPLREIFTCSIGRKPSKALFYLNSVSEVNTLLETLASSS